MKSSFDKLFLIAAIFTIVAQASVFGQQVTIKPFAVNASTLLEDIKTLKSTNPKLSTEELVKNANALLQKQGLNYSFALDSGICQKVDELKKKQKTPTAPISLNAKLNSFEGDKANITLPPVRFGKVGGNCFSLLPLLEVTQNDFVTFIENRTVKFYRPENFNFNEIVLVDNKTFKANVRSWKVPFCTTPLSVSEDGKMLYLSLPADELREMVLIAYDEGTIQFYPKKDIDLTEKSVALESLPKTLNLPNSSFISFGTGEKQRVLKLSNTCE
jgi:hypothetical protein